CVKKAGLVELCLLIAHADRISRPAPSPNETSPRAGQTSGREQLARRRCHHLVGTANFRRTLRRARACATKGSNNNSHDDRCASVSREHYFQRFVYWGPGGFSRSKATMG